MTSLTFATGAVAGAAVVAALLVPRIDSPADAAPRPQEPPVCDAIGCRYVPTPRSLTLEQRLERQGYRCTERARLSKSVIVDLETGAKVLPFDAAMRIGTRGTGWLRSYCSLP